VEAARIQRHASTNGSAFAVSPFYGAGNRDAQIV